VGLDHWTAEFAITMSIPTLYYAIAGAHKNDTTKPDRTDRSMMICVVEGSLITPAGRRQANSTAALKVFGAQSADPAARMHNQEPRWSLDEPFAEAAPSHAIRDSRSGSSMQSVEPNTLQRVFVSANGGHELALLWSLLTSPTFRPWWRGSQCCACNQ
jgi:hypothetical protein